jgi:hypothetical protein
MGRIRQLVELGGHVNTLWTFLSLLGAGVVMFKAMIDGLPLSIVLTAGFVVFAAILWAIEAGHRLRDRWMAQSNEEGSSSVAMQTKANPVFGCPRQEAKEEYLSWWHVPVTWSEGKREFCTVELRYCGHSGPPTRLQWQKIGSPSGEHETTLIDGRNRLVPVSLRDERHDASGVRCQITGTAYLVDHQQKFPIPEGGVLFRLVVRSGQDEWQSPEYFQQHPREQGSNGQFILMKWHGGKD